LKFKLTRLARIGSNVLSHRWRQSAKALIVARAAAWLYQSLVFHLLDLPLQSFDRALMIANAPFQNRNTLSIVWV
jgi:hypothetical protein